MTWQRIARDGLVLMGIIAAAVYWVYLTQTGGSPVDVHAFWVADPESLYVHPDLAKDGYYYSPAFEFVVGWWRFVPFEVYVAIWRAILLGILVYLAGPFTLLVLFTVPVASEINAGNIQLMLALAVVLGFRWPATWAFVVLTKLTPGVGLLWFAVRREWRSFGIAAGLTVAIVALSFALAPWMWRDYVGALAGAPDETPFKIWWRLPIAALVVIWGARSNHRWAMIVAVFLAMPRWYFLSPVVLVGLFPLVRFPRPLPFPRFLQRLIGTRGDQTAAASTSAGRSERAPSS